MAWGSIARERCAAPTPRPAPAGRGLGRGAGLALACIQRAPDGLEDGFPVQQDFMIREAHDPDRERRQELLPRPVSQCTVQAEVLAAVSLDRELRRRTVEVEHVGPDGMLASELEAAEPLRT